MPRKTKTEKVLVEYMLTFGPRQLFAEAWHADEYEWLHARLPDNVYRESYLKMQELAIQQGWPELGGFEVEHLKDNTFWTIKGEQT